MDEVHGFFPGLINEFHDPPPILPWTVDKFPDFCKHNLLVKLVFMNLTIFPPQPIEESRDFRARKNDVTIFSLH